MTKKIGRPLGKNLAKTNDAKRFFKAAHGAGLSLKDIHEKLMRALGEGKCPSYRTLQEWRRGTYTPHFVPFSDWEKKITES
ncbi:hypothetical protein [Kangiella sp. TOML190]|uniref:hypothetical protein n=1 Tax=Kangiella sp. TOML190 TaxID=2931351 RepID=UPI00203F4027|nr:hypothetical protein [Kangiella sp. TOML190]